MKRIQPALRGFAAIAGLFLVVVLAALGAFMVTISNTQQLTSAQDIQGTRVYWAAQAGLEWGISTVAVAAGPPYACFSSPMALGTVEGYTVSVTCTVPAPYVEGTQQRYIFQITSQAVSGTPGSATYIERSVSASLER